MPDGISIPGGPSFVGLPQPPDVPCDPTGDGWRGPPGINGDVISGGPFLPLTGGTVSRTDTVSPNTPVVAMNWAGPTATSSGSPGVLQINSTPTDITSGFPWGINANIRLSSNGAAQPVGIASSIWRTAGNSPAFCYFGQVVDTSGVGPTSAVLGEFDMTVCGPDGATAYYNPSTGARVGFNFGIYAANMPDWVASNAYAVGDLINPTDGTSPPSTNPNSVHSPYVYKCTTAGTSAATRPALASWPTSGTITDGTVVWAWQTTWAPQLARMIQIRGSGANGGVKSGQLGTGLYFTDVSIYNAFIDMTHNVSMSRDVTTGVLLNPNVAAIRIAPDWPIDFSGQTSPTLQNQRTLKYSSTTNCLEYQTLGTLMLAIADHGSPVTTGLVAVGGTPSPGFQFSVLGTNIVGLATSGGAFATGLRLGTQGASAVLPAVAADGQKLSFDASDGHYLQYRSSTQRLYYVVGGTDRWSVDASGNMRCAGTVTPSVTP